MSSDSSWSALPADILQRAFELQPEGLAICGAASSCSMWRNIARHSQVNNLHLHSTTNRQEQFWAQLLTARKCIDTLKLTSQRIFDLTEQIYPEHQSDEVAEATISSIPTACRSLSLSEFPAYGLQHYIAKSPEVQQLSLQWNGLQDGHGTFHPLPCFFALRQLTQLTVHLRNDINGESFPSLVKSCPDTVDSLILEGFGSSGEVEQPPAFAVSSLGLLQDNLPALTRLDLAHSVVRVPGEDITCLSKLKSLSLCHSEIYVDGQLEVTLLTNLTHLDLTGATCYWEDAWVDVLDAFTAWPCLAVFKVYECNLLDMSTVMDLSTVREVHLGYFSHYAQPKIDQECHVHVHVDSVFKYDSTRAATIVDLTLDATKDTFPDSLLGSVAAVCPLRSLTLHPGPIRGIQKPLDFPGAGFSNLKHLALTRLYPSPPSVDLQCLLCLTSLDLCTDRFIPFPVTSILLPSKLEALTYLGYDLFISDVRHNLHELPSLTKVRFHIGFPKSHAVLPQICLPQPCLPQLPLSLVHLILAGADWCRPDCDWSGLHGCPNLQHLTLAVGVPVFGQLKVWVQSARCLYVVDQLEDGDDVDAVDLLEEGDDVGVVDQLIDGDDYDFN